MFSRDGITAALTSTGAGAKGWIEQLARVALSAALLGEFADPRRIAAALGYEIRDLVIGADVRAFVEGRRLSCLWRLERGENGLNAFIGLAMARLEERGLPFTSRDVVHLVAALALPGFERSMAIDLEQQRHLPPWFVSAFHRGRGTAPEVRLVVAR